jgi:lysyl endopeptidase
MKHFLTLILQAFVITSLSAQISYDGQPIAWDDTQYHPAVDMKVMPEVDLVALATADAVTDQFKDVPWRFGVEQEVAFNLENSGVWSFEDGLHVWRLGFHCPDAENVSLFLSRFVMPKGGKLVVWNASRSDYLGAFTHENNKEWESLSVGLIEGSTIVLEYQVTPEAFGTGELEVGQVIHGYRSLLKRQQNAAEEMQSRMGPFGNSGACNININCPEGAAWQTEKRSVALIVSGGYAACTGALVNNTANDGTPYFLTANHCLGNPSSWVYYFNHESSSCSGA